MGTPNFNNMQEDQGIISQLSRNTYIFRIEMKMNSVVMRVVLGVALMIHPHTAYGAAPTEGYALVAGTLFEVEIASSPTQRQFGLSNRGLSKDKYFMVFIFDYPQKVNFWMKDTKIDLSIAFIDSKNKVSEISSLKAKSLKNKVSRSSDILYALEVPKEFFKRNNIVIGDDFQLFK
jgi:uncharacterized membrane protein (UPF0127 family)